MEQFMRNLPSVPIPFGGGRLGRYPRNANDEFFETEFRNVEKSDESIEENGEDILLLKMDENSFDGCDAVKNVRLKPKIIMNKIYERREA